MKATRIIILFFLLALAPRAAAQNFALKTNALYWAGITPNLGCEVALNHKWTFDIQGVYNPWKWSEGRRLRFWGVQPEFRYWLCEKFEGHFIGIHAHGGQWYGSWNKYRRDGWMAGGGIVYGYDWILSPHWNLEAALGLGYARLWWKESDRLPCIKDKRDRHHNYWGPTKVSLTFSYIF